MEDFSLLVKELNDKEEKEDWERCKYYIRKLLRENKFCSLCCLCASRYPGFKEHMTEIRNKDSVLFLPEEILSKARRFGLRYAGRLNRQKAGYNKEKTNDNT